MPLTVSSFEFSMSYTEPDIVQYVDYRSCMECANSVFE